MSISEQVAEIVRNDPRTELVFGLIRSAASIEGASEDRVKEALARAALDILATNVEAQELIVGKSSVLLN